MMYVLYFSSLFFNTLFGFTKKHSRIIAFMTILFIVIMFGFNTNSLDNINYIRHYNNISSGVYSSNPLEFGFIILMWLGNVLGLNWIGFKTIISLFCFILIYKFIKKYTNNLNLVIFFYLLHNFFMDAEQIRNFIALSIFIYSLKFLLVNNFKNNLIYSLLILIAATVHNSFIFYLPLIFINIKKTKYLHIILVFSFILTSLTILNGNEIPLLEEILMNLPFDNYKIKAYLQKKTRYGFVIPFFLHIINFYLVFYVRKIIFKINSNKSKLNKTEINYINLVYYMNFIAFIYFPLYIQTINYYRLTRNFTLLNFTLYSIAYKLLEKKQYKKIFLIILILLNIFTWFMYDIAIRPHEILIPFFNNLI